MASPLLWIALHLPLLSLESFAALLPVNESADRPIALLDAHEIRSANAAAQALGVKAGIKRATALALAPHLLMGQADAIRDAEALQAVAHAALAFTPMVVIQPPSEASPGEAPHTVLLEVQASLRCFGGLARLERRLLDSLAPLGHRVHLVVAGTALGAALLARVHSRLHCPDLGATRQALDGAPLWLLGPGRAHWEALQGMGLHTFSDLQGVPRGGLARRFGELVLGEFDRATGARPDPRVPIALPPVFESRLELFARADTTEQLMHGAAVLLARLFAWLSAQHAFVRRFELVMAHEKRSRRDTDSAAFTTLEVALAEPSRDSAHLLVLLRERLARLQLPAPTMELSLRAQDIARRAPPNAELFPTQASEREGLTRLIERVQARLGREQVQRLARRDDHRPERTTVQIVADARMRPARASSTPSASMNDEGARASSSAARPIPSSSVLAEESPASPVRSPAALVRPAWLIEPPEPLRQEGGILKVDGRPVQLLNGPERIESGWWDDARIERDYFIAQLPDGALVWLFRERVPAPGAAPGWFLQGRFG